MCKGLRASDRTTTITSETEESKTAPPEPISLFPLAEWDSSQTLFQQQQHTEFLTEQFSRDDNKSTSPSFSTAKSKGAALGAPANSRHIGIARSSLRSEVMSHEPPLPRTHRNRYGNGTQSKLNASELPTSRFGRDSIGVSASGAGAIAIAEARRDMNSIVNEHYHSTGKPRAPKGGAISPTSSQSSGMGGSFFRGTNPASLRVAAESLIGGGEDETSRTLRGSKVLNAKTGRQVEAGGMRGKLTIIQEDQKRRDVPRPPITREPSRRSNTKLREVPTGGGGGAPRRPAYYAAWSSNSSVDAGGVSPIQKKLEKAPAMELPLNRETIGGFELIFPFNKHTEELAVQANRNVNTKNPAAPNFVRMIVQEIKNYETLFLKNHKR